MKKFIVKGYTIQKNYFKKVVEAETEDQARDIAEEDDPVWDPSDDYDVDWQDDAEIKITSVEEE